MRTAICLVTLALIVPAAAQDVPEYVCLPTDAVPVIDGALDDPCWQAAERPPVFHAVGQGMGPAANPTRVRMVMDAEALYVAVDAEVAPGHMPSAQQRDRDGKVWNDAGLEIFLADDFTTRDYYHMIFTAAECFADIRHAKGLTPQEGLAWNPDWEMSSTMREGGWSGEARIPWAAFGLDAAPPQGWVWRVKLGAHASKYLNSMWPPNSDTGFHSHDCWGYLVFGDRNLASNPGFEDGIPEGTRPPRGWSFAYYPTEGEGLCTVTDEDAASGEFAGRLHKFDDHQWFPVLYAAQMPVQPGSTYEISAMVKCDKPYRMRYTLSGQQGGKRGSPMPATDGWQRVSMEATVPEDGVTGIVPGFQLIRAAGVILVDDMMVRRMNEVAGSSESIVIPHPFHRLEELASRTAFKPYSLLADESGRYQSDLVIFRDSGTGAEIWMMARSGGASTRHMYMEMSPWNADGSLLAFHSGQLGKGTIMMPADGSSWEKLPFYASGFQWDRRDRERLFFRQYRGHDQLDHWDLAVANIVTGEQQATFSYEGDIGIWPMSQDGEKLLVQEKILDEAGEPTSRLWIMNRDGADGLMLTAGGWIHQSWFTKAGDYSVEFEWEGQKPYGQFMITTDNEVHKIADAAYGHRAHSPDGVWLAPGGQLCVINKQTREIRVISDYGSGHQTWETDPNWYAASSGRYLRRVVAFGSSPTAQLLGAHNSQLKHSTYWSEAHPEMSRDGTKLGYASSMLGNIEFYQLIMRRPDAPTLESARTGEGLRLTWEPGKYHTETRGYLVYESIRSGEWGKCITPEPVTETEYLVTPDRAPRDDAGRPLPAFYRVTALEHSGLESLPSNEIQSISDMPLPRSIYSEAEAGQYVAPAAEVFDPTAAGLYALSRGELRVSGPVTVPAYGPEWATAHRLWVRARSQDEVSLSATTGAADGDFGSVAVASEQWQWLLLPETPRPRGGVTKVTLEASAPGVVVDRVLVSCDPDYTPTGVGGMDETAPEVTGLTAGADGRYATRLAWQPADAVDLHHYNIYCGASADFEMTQERLIASPSARSYVDWGLKPGRDYHYRITGVDRSGNESAPTPVASARTEPLADRVLLELPDVWDTTASDSVELPFAVTADTAIVFWGKVQSLNGARSASVEVLLDDRPLGKLRISFDYICVGHGGPVLKTWLWDCMSPARTTAEDPMAWPVSAGDHTLTLKRTDGLEVLYEGFVITDDLGFEPEGTVDFKV